MPLLLYCLTESEPAVPPPKQGVRGRPVERQAIAGMQCYYSVFPHAPTNLAREDALVFHSVVTAIFAKAAVTPFRFPTVLEGEDELEVFLETEGHDLLESLQRLRDFVQMEVRLSYGGERVSSAESGTEHLKTREHARKILEQVAESARDFLAEGIRGWHTREFPNGLRCYALIPRGEVASFRHNSEGLKPEGKVRVAVSGPWPPTEFLHEPLE